MKQFTPPILYVRIIDLGGIHPLTHTMGDRWKLKIELVSPEGFVEHLSGMLCLHGACITLLDYQPLKPGVKMQVNEFSGFSKNAFFLLRLKEASGLFLESHCSAFQRLVRYDLLLDAHGAELLIWLMGQKNTTHFKKRRLNVKNGSRSVQGARSTFILFSVHMRGVPSSQDLMILDSCLCIVLHEYVLAARAIAIKTFRPHPPTKVKINYSHEHESDWLTHLSSLSASD